MMMTPDWDGGGGFHDLDMVDWSACDMSPSTSMDSGWAPSDLVCLEDAEALPWASRTPAPPFLRVGSPAMMILESPLEPRCPGPLVWGPHAHLYREPMARYYEAIEEWRDGVCSHTSWHRRVRRFEMRVLGVVAELERVLHVHADVLTLAEHLDLLRTIAACRANVDA